MFSGAMFSEYRVIFLGKFKFKSEIYKLCYRFDRLYTGTVPVNTLRIKTANHVRSHTQQCILLITSLLQYNK